MLAAARAGAVDEALGIAKRIQELVVPEQNYYFRAFVQFNMAVASMLEGDYAKAWLHITESERHGEIHRIPQAGILNAQVIGLILGELGKHQEALDHYAKWHDKWLEYGCLWMASAADVETASILAKSGEMDKAREYFERAESLVDDGMATQYLRPLAFTEQLKRKLFPDKAPLISLADWQDAPISIETFGDLHIRVNRKAVVDRKRKGGRTKALLKALIVLGGKDVSADRLQDILWPDASGEKAAKSLKSAIYRLKRVGLVEDEIPLPWIKVRERRVSLDSSLCSIDSLLFSEALSSASRAKNGAGLIRQALDLYKGDFLAQDVQEAWIIRHRESLQKLYVDGAAVLARRLLESGDSADSIPYLEKALELNPVHEPTYSILMEIHLEMGYPAQTLQVYEQARTRLKEELGIEPGPDLTSLAQKAGLKH
jgi:DNA-binding SARP family transcriptional activator